MLFNSIEFGIFLPVVFLLYWLVFQKNLKLQNIFLLLVSYLFYGWWDWRFLSLIIFSSGLDYIIGNQLGSTQNEKKRKWLLASSVTVNLGFLMFFKYFNFFAESFADAFTLLGAPMEVDRLNIVLPVGISFYTFQTLSYSIDIYRRKLTPAKDIVSFFAFVSFFPQLVAGPIERAVNLLPQFYKKRSFSYNLASDGMKQILWGLFKKVVIADNCAQFVNEIFNNYQEMSGVTLISGAVLFTFQIYGDFSGYSDIAIGTSKLFGFNLMKNFSLPYFSRDIAEFWRRWHISLSTWFRDYLYIPLGGSKGGLWRRIVNTFIIFVVSGFWHGANWTFIFWGFLNACYFLPLLLLNRNRKNLNTVAEDKLFPSFRNVIGIILTFSLTVLAWIFFRADNIVQAFDYIRLIFTPSKFLPIQILTPKIQFAYTFIMIALMVFIEWLQRNKDHTLEIRHKSTWFRWTTYSMLFLLIITFGFFGKNEFIYFQF